MSPKIQEIAPQRFRNASLTLGNIAPVFLNRTSPTETGLAGWGRSYRKLTDILLKACRRKVLRIMGTLIFRLDCREAMLMGSARRKAMTTLRTARLPVGPRIPS